MKMAKHKCDYSVLVDVENALDEAYEAGYRDGHDDAEIELAEEV